MSFVQIYMEDVHDLLKPGSDPLQLREDPAQGGVFLENVQARGREGQLTTVELAGRLWQPPLVQEVPLRLPEQEVQIRSVEECLQLLQLGERNRVYALTNLNAHSSRSHAVVVFTVEKRRVQQQQQQGGSEPRKVDGLPPPPPPPFIGQGRHLLLLPALLQVTVGKLYMVDLAGSERLKKSRSEGLRYTWAGRQEGSSTPLFLLAVPPPSLCPGRARQSRST